MNNSVKKMVEDILSVQPMPKDCMKTLFEQSSDQEDLIKDGYKPVSRIGLLWIKEDEKDE